MIDIEKIRRRLLALEKDLSVNTVREVNEARGELLDTAHDIADASVADVAIETKFSEAELNSVVLQQVRDALRRIDEGTFGRCVVDEGPIEENRLEAVPWSPYCLKHQALLEAAGSERNWTL